MPHEVETMAFVAGRGYPWHYAETKDRDTELATIATADEMLAAAGLDWTVSQRPIYVPTKAGTFQPIPRFVANTRDSDDSVLGVVKPAYHVLQNHDAFGLADDIVDSGEAKYDTAGSLRGGAIVFLSMVIPEGIKVEGDDSAHELFLLVTNGHDGRHGLNACVTVVRAVCKNTVDAAFGKAITRFSLRHRSGMEQRIGEARRALGITFQYKDTFEAVASSMARRDMTKDEVVEALKGLFPVPEDIAKGREENTVFAGVLRNWETSPTLDHIRPTAWGVYNAITEYFDHIADYRGGVATSKQDARTESILFGRTADIRANAMRVLAKV
jgi:phage/plasmid-like protein (TIGR03299 family)